ncbi:MAG: hypothetical protein PVI26_10135 [Chitinispirillia bacterium]|jgi:hypothetical protein
MTIENKSKFLLGSGLLITFFIVLILVFLPIFKGKNGLEFLDNLYNSISKGSAYYIPKVLETTEEYNGTTVNVTIKSKNDNQLKLMHSLLSKTADADISGQSLTLNGDLGKILAQTIEDADKMYKNDGKTVSRKYGGADEKELLYTWYETFHLMDKELKKQKKFKEARILNQVLEKCVEPSYNFYKIEPQKISDKVGIVFFSLIFYVIYTIWFGFAIMYLFEGFGLRFGH